MDLNTAPVNVVVRTEDECIPNNVIRDTRGFPVYNEDGSYKTSGEEKLDTGPQAAKVQGLTTIQQIPKSFLVSVDNPNPPGGIGRLTTLHIKAVMTMIGQTVSGFSYDLIGPADFVGKYQLEAETLKTLGYLKPEFVTKFGRAAVKKDAAWTGKDGIFSLRNWFGSAGVQEKVMYDLLQSNYEIMSRNNAIKSDDNLCTIAGMLCVAHILGPGDGTEKNPGAKRWRASGGGRDTNGFFGTNFFSLGRYAVDVLAARTNG
jgi:hypothetical protein